MSDKITHTSLMNALFEHIDDNTGRLNPPELDKQWSKFADKWIDPVYPKAQYDNYDQVNRELWELLQAYKRNAFTVGFEAAAALLQNGGAA